MKHFFILLIIGFSLSLFTACKEKEEVSNYSDDSLYLWSHNDYEQEEPLFGALNHGFQMIEVDVHLIDEELYVTHDHPQNIEGTPLLEDLYLQPLVKFIKQNNGEVLPGDSLPFYLIVDIKTEADSTYQALLHLLENYKEYFYRKESGRWIDGPIRLLISGNRPELKVDVANRIIFLDGRIPNLGMDFSSDLYPLISDNWSNYFSWDGNGEMPNDELEKLRTYVSRAHQEDKLIRFWVQLMTKMFGVL